MSLLVSAQKEDHQWIFNETYLDDVTDFPDLGASILDFNILPPRAYRETAITLDMDGTQAIYCGPDGILEMYTNGQSIHGRHHEPLVNGDSINYTPQWDWLTWENEHGEIKPSGFRIARGASIIPIPETQDDYLLLYENYERRDSNDRRDELWSGRVTRNDDGVLEVMYKDSTVMDRMFARGKLTACKHGNGRDWWFHVFDADTVYTYIVDPSGLHLSHTQVLPVTLDQSLGQAKYSPDGSKFALYSVFVRNNRNWSELFMADFDRCSGYFTNIQYEASDAEADELGRLGNGMEFSSNGEFLYTNTSSTIFQYNVKDDNLFQSRVIIAERGQEQCELFSNRTIFFGQMQLGPDKKIYVGQGVQCSHIHVINSPNTRGPECDFQLNGVPIPTYHWTTIPNVNTYRLGPLDGSSCDTLGLENNPVSRFWYEQDSLDFLSVQFWDVSYFRPEEWLWDFGDGNVSSEQQPTHSYAENGVYEVCLTVSNENSSDTSCKTLFLGTSSTEEFSQPDFSLYPNPTDGLTRLMLQGYLPREGVLRLYDLQGKLVLSQAVRTGASVLDLSSLDIGTYVYELQDGKNLLKSGKVVRI